MDPEKDDLRSALEEAYDGQEGGTDTPSPEAGRPAEDTAEPVRTAAPTERSEPVGDTTKSTDQPAPAGEVKTDAPKAEADGTPYKNLERAPESWKPVAKESWGKLPAEVRDEVVRREREIVMTLQNTAGARRLAEQYHAAVAPFEMMVRTEGSDMITATRELFGQAAILRIGTPVQKAQLVAGVIKRFNVPIKDLDTLLVGEVVPDEDSKIAQIIQQQLAPVRQFMNTIEGVRTQREKQVDSSIETEIVTFANDKANEFFFDVKDEMADLIELATRREQPITLRQAYDKAVSMNDGVQQVVVKRNQEKIANAKRAGSSLPSRGAPISSPHTGGDDIRGDLLAAFDTLASR
jgi:hypothetical protein